MSRSAETTTEKPKTPLRHRARQTGALIMSTAALGGLVAPAARAEQASAGASQEAARVKLRSPQELPGLKIHLGKETLDKIKQSTVEIGQRIKQEFFLGDASAQSWMPGCTAVKVSIPGQKDPFIMTAAHCFWGITGVQSGVFSDPAHPRYHAENFTTNFMTDLAVLDPAVGYDARISQPVATIDQISIDTNNTDVALLHPAATDASALTAPNIRPFDAIPAIPLNIAEKAPLQGTPVALYGEPQANNFEPVAGTGTYLGRVSVLTYNSPTNGVAAPPVVRQLDLVGINPDKWEDDNCNYGTSGSMALLPNGKLLGNLSFRTNQGYGLEKTMHAPDQKGYDTYIRSVWENELNVKMSGFTTICGYTVMTSKTPKELMQGFNTLAPPPPGGKGGQLPIGVKP